MENALVMGLDDFFEDHVPHLKEDHEIFEDLLDDRKTSEVAFILGYPVEGKESLDDEDPPSFHHVLDGSEK